VALEINKGHNIAVAFIKITPKNKKEVVHCIERRRKVK